MLAWAEGVPELSSILVSVWDCKTVCEGFGLIRKEMAVSDTTGLLEEEMIDPMTGEIINQKELAEQLLAQAKEQGVSLVEPGGLLSQLTNVLEIALNAELTEHLGHEHGGTPMTANMRSGTRTKTVLTEIGRSRSRFHRDRDGSFEPVIVPKRKRRLDGIDQIVLSLTARGLTTGEIAAHFEEVYGAEGLQGHDQSDHREGHRRAGRMGVAPVGSRSIR